MLTLGPTDSLSGLASSTGVQFTALGDDIVGAADSFKELAQLAVPTSAGTLVAAVAGHQTLIKYAAIANTNGTAASVTLYINGTASANQVGQFVIPANGRMEHTDEGWKVYDSSGFLQYVGATGPAGTRGSIWYGAAGAPGTIAGQANSDWYLNLTNGNTYELVAGTWTLEGNIQGPQGPTGLTGSPGAVNSVAVANPSIVLGGTSAAPTFKTGTLDVLAAQGPPVAAVALNGQKLTGGAAASAGTDLPIFSQTPAGGSLVTNAMLATMAADTVKGSVAGGTPVDLTQVQQTAMLNVATILLQGLMSPSDKRKLNLLVYDVVADYGADPTGVSNSATAIQNAVNAAQAAGYAGGSGGIIWFPAGRYLIGSTIRVTGDNITFWGAGAGSSQDFGNYYTGMGSALVPTGAIMAAQVLPVQTNGLSGQPNTGFKWRGLAVDCYASNGTFGLQLLSCVNFDVDDFYAINATNTGLDFNTLPGAVTTGSTVWATNTAPTTINVNATTASGTGPAFAASGTIIAIDGGGTKRAVAYTSTTGTTFAGCTVVGGVATAGTVTAGSPVQVLPGAQDCTRGRCGQMNFRSTEGGVTSASMCMQLGGDGAGLANTNLIKFVGPIKIAHLNGNGIQDINSDSNHFDHVIINRSAGGTGLGVMVGGSSVSAALASRNNTFGLISPGAGGMTFSGGTFPSGPTYVTGYQLANGEAIATISTNAIAEITYNGAISRGLRNISNVATLYTASTLTLVPGSVIELPQNAIQVGTTFRWRVPISRTAAGTAGRVLSIRIGTTGTTADAIVQTWAAGTATAAIDSGWMDVTYTITAVGAAATGAAVMQLHHAGATTPLTGLDTRSDPIVIGTPTAFNSATAVFLFVSLSLTTGAAAVETTTGTTAEVVKIAA